MSRARWRLSLRGAALLLIVVAQLLIPLLHGHFGTPNQAGLHVHVTPSKTADSHFHSLAHTAHDQGLHDDGEPFEVDVQGALQPLNPLPLPLLAAVGLALLTFGLRAAQMRSIAPRPAPRIAPTPPPVRWRGVAVRPFAAQAPPTAF